MRVIAVGIASLLAATAQAQAKVPTESERAAQAIERTLQRHGKDVHRCFEKALADRLDVAGKVELEVDVGQGGKVEGARVVSPEKGTPRGLSPCLLASAAQWKVDGVEPGVSIVLPFAFQGQMNQFVVKAADAPDRGPGAGKGSDKPRQAPPFTVKVLADGTNVRAQQLSLTLLSVGPASRVAMHRHPRSAKVLYLLKGHARLLGPAGTPPTKVEEGMAVFVPAAYPHVIENMGRTSTAVFLQAFAPPGPERVYRDPKDVQGRADFEVIRDPGKAKAPPAANGKLVARSASDATALPMAGVRGSTARILLEPQVTGSQAIAVDLLEFAPGVEVPRHQHAGSAEVLYVVAGGGTLNVGSESYPFGAEEVIHIPPDQPHGGKFAGGDKTIAIQFYAPAGPEQRFRAAKGEKK